MYGGPNKKEMLYETLHAPIEFKELTDEEYRNSNSGYHYGHFINDTH